MNIIQVNCTLTSVDLSHANIGVKEAAAIGNALQVAGVW